MPNKASAAKAKRQDDKRAIRNRTALANIRDLRRHFRVAITKKDQTRAQELLVKITVSLDKAVKKNIIKKNTASRRKSRLTKKVNALSV